MSFGARIDNFHAAVAAAVLNFTASMEKQGYKAGEFYDVNIYDHAVSKRSKKTGLSVELRINFPEAK